MATCVSSWEPKWILLPALERTSVAPEVSVPLQIKIRSVEGVNVPDKTHGYQIYVSLYDAVYRCFFGRQWQGPVAACPQGKAASTNLSYQQTIYMHTSLNNNNVFAVIELLACTKDAAGQNKCRSIGWGMMRLFSQNSKLPDSSQSSQIPLKTLQFYKGTPRALYLMDEPVENCQHLRKIPGCMLSFTLCTHRAMYKVIHLLPENVFFSRSDEVPGLQSSGDSFRKPKLSPTVSCQLHHILLSMPPNVAKFEDELCQLLNEDHYNSNKQTTGIVSNQCINIAERRLKISVHNGWGYIGKQHTVHLDLDYVNTSNSMNRRTSSPSVRRRIMHRRSLSGTSNSSSSAAGLVLNSPCLIENLVDSPQCSVVFSLEYVVTEPLMEEHMKLVHCLPRALNRVLLVRWCVWKPFDLTSSEQDMVGNLLTVPLFAGPSPNPDEVFVYKGPSTEMHDEHLARLAPGTIQFRVLLQEQGDTQGYGSSVGEDLVMKTENLAQQYVSGKPPLPSSSPRLQANKSNLLQPLSPQQQQQQQQLHPFLKQGVPINTGYTAAGHPSVSPRMNIQQQPLVNIIPYTGISQHQLIASQYQGVAVNQLTEKMVALTTTDLTELQYTPSHASAVIQVPQADSTRSLSRASYTRLYNAGFPSLLDRNGDLPEVIDPEKDVEMIPASKQIRDPLSCNEIVFQFLAFSKMLDLSSKGPNTIFFTFQFYKYPPLTTERLVLCKDSTKHKPSDQPALYILNKVNKDDTPLKSSPGYEVHYFVDPCFLKPGEPILFLQHLQQQILHIDVWDGDSLLLIGSCSVPLKYACRNGHEAVQCTVELDVLTTEYDEDIEEVSEDLGKLRDIQPYGVPAICKGQLHFRIANIGHPPTNPSEPNQVMTDLPVKSHVILSHLSGESEFGGGSLVSGKKKVAGTKKRVARAGHLLNTHPELRTVIASKNSVSATMPSPRNGIKDENTDERKRKLARMEMVRDMLSPENKAPTIVSPKQELSQRARDLKLLDLYRQQTKRDNIMNMLNSAITKEHVLYPSFGVSDFFEFVLKNPNNTQETVSIVFEDQELSVITNTQEWKHFKQLFNVGTPIEEDMFAASSAESKFSEIFMRPKEMIYVPFKLLSLSANHSLQPQGPVDPFTKKKNPKVYNELGSENEQQSRTIKVHFKSKSGEILSILCIQLEYQPHVIDQTFRFHHPENSFLKKSIRLPPLHSLPGVPVGGAGGQRQVFVRCSDSNVIHDCQSKQPGEPLDIFLKVSVGCSPQVKKFFVAIFHDPFLSRPVQVWQIFVHALQRIDISCVEGQTSRFSLILRGTRSSRFARCFTSHPNEMKLHPSEGFTLAAGSVHELNVAIRPSQVGCKCFYVNMVDIEYHQLLRSWLVFTKCESPAITRAFELTLPIGGGRGCNKRVSYTNPYSKRKKFLLHTNRDDLLQFKETQLDISGGDSQNIGLRFAPVLHPGCVELLVFINDEEDKNEETFCIKAIYTDHIES